MCNYRIVSKVYKNVISRENLTTCYSRGTRFLKFKQAVNFKYSFYYFSVKENPRKNGFKFCFLKFHPYL